VTYRFSALQRAENSSIAWRSISQRCAQRFQCSSASRKFLNRRTTTLPALGPYSFSALQRAENSSISASWSKPPQRCAFQCSSASRKFLNRRSSSSPISRSAVSVLFSEPKIPQCIRPLPVWTINVFQCSSASRKFLNAR